MHSGKQYTGSMRSSAFWLCAILISESTLAQSAKEIIEKVDENQVFKTQQFKARMVIQKGSRTLTKDFFGFGQKEGEKSFIEFTNAEDKGVKYLKLKNELWIYFPDADDIMKISGHMLRQGMMGSDISYEDMIETERLEKQYHYRKLADQKIEESTVYVIELNAKVDDAIYDRQILYIHKQYFIPVKIDLYAKGGRLIKTLTQYNISDKFGRFMPEYIEIQDKRRKDSKTTVQYLDVRFNINIPDRMFQRRNLKK